MKVASSHESIKKSRPFSHSAFPETNPTKGEKKDELRLNLFKNTNLMAGMFKRVALKEEDESLMRPPSTSRIREVIAQSPSRLRKKLYPQTTRANE